MRASRNGSLKSFAPLSIGARFYAGKSLDEIKQENPFAEQNWLEQRGSLTRHRKDQIARLFNGRLRLSLDNIRSVPRNEGRYPAFLAIAHGLAQWDAHSQEVVLLAEQE